MLKYEYITREFTLAAPSSYRLRESNELGQQGWILCSTIKTKGVIEYIFKRLIIT